MAEFSRGRIPVLKAAAEKIWTAEFVEFSRHSCEHKFM
jgi:hypothetical protein